MMYKLSMPPSVVDEMYEDDIEGYMVLLEEVGKEMKEKDMRG